MVKKVRPSLLKIKGINSFHNEQIINFNRLVEKGLFGIFGPTGSGKSSILDAITLALYGNIARDSKEFINTEADRGEVSFEFEILDGSLRKTYRLERGIKRKKNGGIETTVARIIEINGEEVTVLADSVTSVNNEVIRVIGLNAEDFTRSVVLPQGKFSEFLKLTGRERRNMLERIFGLEQYGKNIVEKINAERKKYDAKRMDLEGQLKSYEGVNESYYKEVSEKLHLLLVEEKALKKEIEDLDKEYQQSKKIWELQGEMASYKGMEVLLREKRTEIEEKRKTFILGEKANQLKAYVQNLKSLEERINQNQLALDALEKELPKISKLLKELEDRYQNALICKEEKFPKFIAKIENCKQAEKIEQQNLILAKEIEGLEKIYHYHCNLSKEKSQELEKSKNKVAQLQREVVVIEKTLEEIYLEPSHREALEEGYTLNKDRNRLKVEKNEAEKILRDLDKVIEENKVQLKDELEARQQLESVLKSFFEEKTSLENSPLKEEGTIFAKKTELDQKKNQWKALEQNLSQKIDLNKAIQQLVKTRESLQEQQEKYIVDIQQAESQLEGLKEESRNIEIEYLALKLSEHLHHGEACPVCGSKDHPNPAVGGEVASTADYHHRIQEMTTVTSTLKEKKVDLDIRIAEILKEEELKRSDLAILENLMKDVNLEVLLEEIRKLEVEIPALMKEREAYLQGKNKLEEGIERYKEKISLANTRITELSTKIEKDGENQDTIRLKLDERSQRIKYLSAIIEKINKDLKIEDIAVEYERIKEMDKERSKKEKELKDLRKAVEMENRQKETLQNEVNALNLEKVKNQQQLDGNKEKLSLAREEIKMLTDGNNPTAYKTALQNEMQKVEAEEKELKGRVEKGRGIQQSKLEEKAIAENNKVNLVQEYALKVQELEKLSKEKGFSSIEEIQGYLFEDQKLDILEDEITAYDDEVKKVNQNLERIQKALDGRAITVDQWETLEKSLTTKKNIQEEKAKEIGEVQQTLKDTNVKLEAMKQLKKEENKITHQLDLLSELSKMLEGNRFVEYVAINQLKYIAREASKWLKDITRGRYALELDSSGNFIMRDDFNGGIRRATNTLSGGETFLTSLSLALALSSHIQLKGSAPLEFFFLDEGFGTLDSDLLEIVMTALERLHSEKLSVGIISHVEELKNRVPIKLMVFPPEFGGEGTRVKII